MVSTKKTITIAAVGVAALVFVVWGFSDASIIDKTPNRCTEQANDLTIRVDQLRARANSLVGFVDIDGTISAERSGLWDEMVILQQNCEWSIGSEWFSTISSKLNSNLN